MTENFIAKSRVNGNVTLIEHSKAVTNFAVYLYDSLFNEEKINRYDIDYNTVRKCVAIAAAMHDIGKCDANFQQWVTDKKANEYASVDNSDPYNNIGHHLLSWAYVKQHLSMPCSITAVKKAVLSAILNHHVIYDKYADETANSLMNHIEETSSIEAFNEFFDIMIDYLKDKHGIIAEKCNATDDDDPISTAPIFYNMTNGRYDELEKNSLFYITRSILIYADRMVSMRHNQTYEFVNANTSFMQAVLQESIVANTNGITIINENYNTERLKQQTELLSEINTHANNIVGASAGYGKTLVGLRWLLQDNKRCLWVTPRNIIARGTYESIINELRNFDNGDKLSVALLLGGVYEYGDENSDIIVTNIDNFLAPMVKNNEAHHQINLLATNAIFDEYHEFLSDEPLFASFISMVYARTRFTESKTLLLSATSLRFDNYYWNKGNSTDPKSYPLQLPYEYVHYIKPEAFNGNMNVNIKYLEVKQPEDINIEEQDAFVITNTVKQAQNFFAKINSEDKKLLHALFTKKDREEIENYLYSTHGKNGRVQDRKLFVGTNVIGVGLDVSAKTIYDFVITPENTIQRACGRGGRFAEKEYNNEITYYICDIHGDRGSSMLTNTTFTKSLQRKWIDAIRKYDGQTITKNKLYDLYEQFYKDNEKEVWKLWNEFFRDSMASMKQMKPYHNRKKNKTTENKTLGSGIGFRGYNNSIYVTAQNADNNQLCDPIIIDYPKISEKIHGEEYTKTALKERKKYLFSRIQNLKYIEKNMRNKTTQRLQWYSPEMNELAVIGAKSMDVPFLLYYARYDRKLGLILGNQEDMNQEDD